MHLAIDKPSTFRDPMTTVSTTIALSVAPVRNEILSAALARELGQSCILRVTQQNVEADHLVATSILERWNNSSDVEQASLLGASNDGLQTECLRRRANPGSSGFWSRCLLVFGSVSYLFPLTHKQ